MLNKLLDIGKRSIMNQLEAIKVTGQNISNINTPGYSRQKVELKSVTSMGNDSINSLEAQRVRDIFIDQNFRMENHTLGKWDMQTQLYGQIESIFLEPSEKSLNNMLSEFWNSWEDLANNPQNSAPRSVVVQNGVLVSQSINRIESQLRDTQLLTNRYLEDKVTQVNDIANQIANINKRVVSTEASGQEASEVRDNRDLLLDQMSSLVDIKVIERETGSMSVYIGGRAIVDDAEAYKIETQPSTHDPLLSEMVWSEDKDQVNISSGGIQGLLFMQDQVIPAIQEDIDQVASTLIDAVNTLHIGGFDLNGDPGLDFFTGDSASNIAVNSEIFSDSDKVSASETGEPGGNGVALAIANLSNQEVPAINTDIGTFYSNIVSELGTQSRGASMMRENAEILMTQLDEQRQSVSGVSLEEETANLIRYQRAYEAAASYMSTVDEMMKTIIDMV
ncbi:flagellar hook-associated protein FlgK [Candidatus Poribacteria bacterium]|nr:flagellar hook-associated protein FlgK [Candidatus Poribacteria bacterium]